MGILRRGGRLHSVLGGQLAGRKVLIRHGGRWSVGKGLLLGEAKLRLLRRRLRARQRHGGARRIPLLRYRRHGIGARAVHLGRRDGAGVDEAGRVVHAILRRLEVHDARTGAGVEDGRQSVK